MKVLVKILGLATVALMPAAAPAADYLVYDFHFTGTYTRYVNSYVVQQNAAAGDIIYYLPTSFAGATSATYGYSAPPYPFGVTSYRYTATFSSNLFELTDGESTPLGSDTYGPSRMGDFKVFITPGVPGPVDAVDASKSSASLYVSSYLSPSGAGETRTLLGTIDGLSVANGFGPVTYGFVSAPFISAPEPATYLLWIMGVGALGAALRRRPVRLTSNAVAA